MEKNKIDSRIIRSKRDLAEALEELLQEKNLDDISITEITNKALVSKNTFYNNFKNKNELLNHLFRKYSQQIEMKIDDIINENKEDNKKALHDSIAAIVDFFYTSKFSFERMVKNDNSKSLYFAVNSFINELLQEIMEKRSYLFSTSIPKKFLGYIYSGAFSNMIYAMYSEDTKISKEDCTEYLYSLISSKIANV